MNCKNKNQSWLDQYFPHMHVAFSTAASISYMFLHKILTSKISWMFRWMDLFKFYSRSHAHYPCGPLINANQTLKFWMFIFWNEICIQLFLNVINWWLTSYNIVERNFSRDWESGLKHYTSVVIKPLISEQSILGQTFKRYLSVYVKS